MGSFEEKYYLTNPTFWQGLKRDAGLFLNSLGFFIVWLTKGRRLRQAYRQAQKRTLKSFSRMFGRKSGDEADLSRSQLRFQISFKAKIGKRNQWIGGNRQTKTRPDLPQLGFPKGGMGGNGIIFSYDDAVQVIHQRHEIKMAVTQSGWNYR